MTKDKVSSIIKKYYNILEIALKLDANIELDSEGVNDLRNITILAYYYLTGEELQKEDHNNDN